MPDDPDRVASENALAAVALVELYEHHEVVDYLCAALPPERDVALFVSPYVADRLSPRARARAAAATVLDVRDRDRDAVIRERRAELERFGTCVLVTLGLDLGLADAFCTLRTARVLVVHDARFHFAAHAEFAWTIAATLRRLRYRWRGSWRERLQTHRPWDGFVVGSARMRAFVLAQGARAPVLDVAYALAAGPGLAPPTSGHLRVGIPGTIDFRNRAYGEIEAAVATGIGRPVEWVFPGRTARPGAERWLSALSRAVDRDDSQRLSYLADQGDYHDALRGCDVLVLPLRERMLYAGQYEWGGVTKIAGSENDQITVGRPAFVRRGYTGRDGLRARQRYYDDAASLRRQLAAFAPDDFPPPPTADAGPGATVRWRAFLTALAGRPVTFRS